jgi:hypothetical protein
VVGANAPGKAWKPLKDMVKLIPKKLRVSRQVFTEIYDGKEKRKWMLKKFVKF